jgi:hypothetical protein
LSQAVISSVDKVHSAGRRELFTKNRIGRCAAAVAD